MPPPPRLIHFVTGGFSGATQVAIDLALTDHAGVHFEPLLVLRRKRSTNLQRVAQLRASGLALELVPGWSRAATVWALWRICRRYRPALLVAHGFPEHLLGRWAALWAGVPHLIHVEHNSRERYTWWRLWQARWLAHRTDATIGVSAGVTQSLLHLGMPVGRTRTIANGVDVARFEAADRRPCEAREAALLMTARFSRQKDHLNLIRALAVLRDRYGQRPPLRLAGAGRMPHRQRVEQQVQRLDLQNQVVFLGHATSIADLLTHHRIFVLSTHWEGMPLALAEAMAAGCACVATLVPGVEGMIEHEQDGLLVPPAEPEALAIALHRLLIEPGLAARLGRAARRRALAEFGLSRMRERYAALFSEVCARH